MAGSYTVATELGGGGTDPYKVSYIGNFWAAGPSTGPNRGVFAIVAAISGSAVYETDSRRENVAVGNDLSSVRVGTPPISFPSMTILPSSSVEAYLLAKAGARRTDADDVDARIRSEVTTRRGQIIDSQNQVGGWPTLAQNAQVATPPANPNGDDNADGYTHVEEWLHGLAAAVQQENPAPAAVKNLRIIIP